MTLYIFICLNGVISIKTSTHYAAINLMKNRNTKDYNKKDNKL